MKLQNREKNGALAVSLLLVTLIWSMVCISKRIYPFGDNLLDIGDMAEQCVPVYTHLWDVLHGKKALFFDWYTGMGNNMAGVVWHFGLISPFNLFFFFVKRAAIESSMSVFLWMKLMGICISMYFVLSKWFKELPGAVCGGLCLLYVFSAFNMQYYYAPMWLDVAFMFPLVMYYYFRLLEGKKAGGYLAALTVTCLMGFQHTYMLVLMLVFLTGILAVLGKERYSGAFPRLLGASLISMLLCAALWLPGFLQIMGAERTGDGFSLNEIWSSIWIFNPMKWMKLINLGIPLALFGLAIWKKKKSRPVLFFGYLLLILCLPILLESTNLLWHGGSYFGYTMRFSYMLAFWVIAAGAYGFLVWREAAPESGANRLLTCALSAGACLLFAGGTLLWLLSAGQEMSVIRILLILGMTGLAGIMLFWRKTAYSLWLMLAFAGVLSAVFAYDAVSVAYTREQSAVGSSSRIAEDTEAFGNAERVLSRLKSLDVTLSHNLPMIMERSSMSAYLAVDGKEQVKELRRLGYAGVGNRMSSYGGTLFSDALLGVDQVIAREEPNNRLYAPAGSYGSRTVYDSVYGYEDGIVLREKEEPDGADCSNPFAYQNRIAKAVLGTELFAITCGQAGTAEISISGESLLYLYSPDMEQVREVTVRDESTGSTRSIQLHESGWDNGILELGIWEKASLQITLDRECDILYCGALDMEKFKENTPEYADNFTYQASARGMELSLTNSDKEGYLFLPVYADEGWECRVNGKKAEISSFAGGMLIPLEAGENELRLQFWPRGFKAGLALSLAGMAVLAAGWVFEKKRTKKAEGSGTPERLLKAGMMGLWLALMMIFYVIPFAYLAAFFLK